MVFLMARPTKLKGSRFPYARKVIPKVLRAIIGRTEWKVPLHQPDDAGRRIAYAKLMQGWEAEIAAARATLRGDLVALSQRQVQTICGEWYRDMLAKHEDDPGKAGDWELFRELLSDQLRSFEGSDGEEEHAFAPSPGDLAEAAAILRKRGMAAEEDSLRRLAERLWDTKLEFAGTMIKRAGGDYSPDTNLPRFPQAPPQAAQGGTQAKPADPLPAETLLDRWAIEATPARNTRKKYGVAFRNFTRVLGFDDVRRISEEDVVRFKQVRLVDQKRSTQTVQDDILAMGAVCRWATKNKLLPANPFADMAPRAKPSEDKRRWYEDDDARRILLAARKETGWLRWLPWLLAFTGARINEVADMHRGHVREENGIPILDFRPTATRRGKNATFQRLVPIHPAVIAEGFLDYVRGLPDDPKGPLFPDLRPAKDGTRTTTATTQHGRWIRGVVGITDKHLAPAHSWRHRMEDVLRKTGASEEQVDAITGHHNPRNAGAGYGKGFRRMPKETLETIRKIPPIV